MTYSPITISADYNASPPPDDGTVSEANRVYWATIKNKLAEPLKTAIEDLNSAVDTEVDFIDATFFPGGTTMLFAQSASPTGWSKSIDTDYDDCLLRVVTESAGTGGTVAFSTAFTDQSFAVTADRMPNYELAHSMTANAHYHAAGALWVPANWGYTGSLDLTTVPGGILMMRNKNQGQDQPYAVKSPAQVLAGAAAWCDAIAITGTIWSQGGNENVSLDFRTKYVDLIVASMD